MNAILVLQEVSVMREQRYATQAVQSELMENKEKQIVMIVQPENILPLEVPSVNFV